MTIKYHVNPHTGQPNICHANTKPCPFDHFNTWEEAQIASQNYMESNFNLLPGKSSDDEIDYSIAPYKYDHLFEWDKVDLYKLLRETDDDELMISVIFRTAKVSDDWMSVVNVTKNPNVPRAFIQDMVKYPNEYSTHMQQLMARSPALTEDDLLTMKQNTEDKDTQYYIMSNAKISKESIMNIIENDPKKLENPEFQGFLDNPNLPSEIKEQITPPVRKPRYSFK